MKFKRILATAFALALTLPLLAVSAHPGRTDSNGGHTDSDTGDYHYHHGWPAHDHYDMNADGAIDCPYEFIDAEDDDLNPSPDKSTGGNWGSGTNGNTHISIDRSPKPAPTTPVTVPSTPAPIVALPEPTFWDVYCDFVGDEGTALLIAISTLSFLVSAPVYYLSNKLRYEKISRIAAPITFLSALVPGFIIAYILCAFFVIFGVLALLWFILCCFWKSVKGIFQAKPECTPIITNMPHPNTTEASDASIDSVIHSVSAQQLTQSFELPAKPLPAAQTSQAKMKSDLAESDGELCYHMILNGWSSDPAPSQPSKTKQPVPPSLPPQTFANPDPDVDFRPVILPESEVHSNTRCRDACRYLWYETLMLRNCTKPLISSDATVYIWTALFYTAVKTLRSQSSVNRIYSYFSETTSEFVTEAQYTDLVVAKVREVYRELREPLNDSGIDPRTANGRRDLWRFLEDHSKELNLRPDLAYEFLCASQRVWEMIKDVFPQAQPYPKAGDIRYSIDDLPSA